MEYLYIYKVEKSHGHICSFFKWNTCILCKSSTLTSHLLSAWPPSKALNLSFQAVLYKFNYSLKWNMQNNSILSNGTFCIILFYKIHSINVYIFGQVCPRPKLPIVYARFRKKNSKKYIDIIVKIKNSHLLLVVIFCIGL